MWLEILGSTGFGAITGGVFGYLGKREERFNLKLQMDHEVAVLKAKTMATVEVAKLTMEQAKLSGMLLVDKIESEAFRDSMKSNNKYSDAIKSMVRPVILAILLYQTWKIMITLEAFTGGLGSLPTSDIIDLYKIVILSITGLTATAVGWYFGARSSKQFDRLLDTMQFRRFKRYDEEYSDDE